MKREEVLKLVNDYWKFDKDQTPTSSWHDKNNLLKDLDNAFKAEQREIVKPKFLEVLGEVLGLTDTIFNESDEFKNMLGVDSLDLIELIMNCETEFEIEITDEAVEDILTIGEAIDLICKLTL